MSNNSSNKKSSGWTGLNDGLYDADAHHREVAERDEKLGFGRLVEDAPIGGLRAKLEELANSNSAETNEVLASHGIANPRLKHRFFISDKTPCVVYLGDDGWHATAYAKEGEINFFSASRDGVMLLAEQSSALHRTPRRLTPEEHLRVARLAQEGDTKEALGLYMELRLDQMPRKSAREVLEDPKLVHVLSAAARFVWGAWRPDYVPSEEFDAILDRVAAEKMLTVNSVDILYDQFVDSKAAAARSRQAAPVAPSETERQPQPALSPEQVIAELENMGAAELEKLRVRTLRTRGRLIQEFDAKMRGGN